MLLYYFLLCINNSVVGNDNGSFSKLVPLLPNNQKRIEIEHKLNLYVKPSKRFTYELKVLNIKENICNIVLIYFFL